MKYKEYVELLWTGGWDSTYRLVELSFKEVTVQPIYIADSRDSEGYELSAMDSVTELLNNKEMTKAEILPYKIINRNEIVNSDAVKKAYCRIAKETNLGSQYEFLASYALQNPGLEIGIEANTSDNSFAIKAINSFGKLKRINDTFVLDENYSSEDLMLVLGNFSYPIIELKETDMVENINKWGYQDVMQKIWFCHHPINGNPCGICHPCTMKMGSGMSFLLPEESQKRYYIQKRLIKLVGKKYGMAICKRIFALIKR